MSPLKVYKASAGSGKTFRLAVEYIALLVKNPTEYQHILAVTFTNKATAEMKQRILSQLYGIAHGNTASQSYVKAIIEVLGEEGQTFTPDEVRERCGKALHMIIHDYSNFRIVTIDSFFQSIVRELANELGLSANISAELDDKTVVQKAVDEIIDNLSPESPEYDSLISYIESHIDEDKSWKIEDSVVKFGANVLNEKFLINDRNIVTDKSKLNSFRQKLNTLQQKQCAQLNEEMYATTAMAHKCIIKSGYLRGMAQHAMNAIIKDWEKIDKWPDTSDKYLDNPLLWLKKDLAGNPNALTFVADTLIPLAKRIKALFDERLKVENDVKASTQNLYNLMLVSRIREQISRLNSDSNRFLLAETNHFLSDVINDSNLPFIYEKTGMVFTHIMIDEFQDTSTLQWQNFKPLLLNCLDANQTCLIVGDVKQSIYRFRNSDWQVLNNIDKTESDMKRYIKPIENDTNFRSAPRVIDFNNKFFDHAIANANKLYTKKHGHPCEPLTHAYENMAQKSAHADCNFGYVRVECLTPDTTDDKPDYDELEHNRILLNVKGLIENGVKASDIAILVRHKREAAAICQYFEPHKDVVSVKLISDEAFRLEASSAVSMIIFALRALAAQNDRLHLTSLAYYYQTLVLANDDIKSDPSPLLMASESELAAHYLPQSFVSEMNSLRYKPIAEIAERIYDQFQLSQLSNQDTYMFFFLDIIEEYASDNLADIDSFLKRWDEELCEKTIPNGNTDGIRLMTIHKSKGLEFHTVIIPHCSWSMEPKGDTLLWCSADIEPYSDIPLLPVQYNATKHSAAFVTDHDKEELLTLVDNINILYVGFTRAESNLIIITDTKQPGPGINNYGAKSFIIDAIESAIADNSLDMTTDTTDELTIYQTTTRPSESPARPLPPDNPTPRFVSFPTKAEFRQSHESDLFISERSESEQAHRHADRIRLISLGNLYHNILQHINTTDDTHHAVMLMEQHGCFEQLAERDETERQIEQLIRQANATHPEWFSPEWRVLSERAILFQSDGDVMEQKRPDRVVVKGDHAIIIDYKTAQGVAHRRADGTIAVPSENKQQIQQYCQLLRQLGFANVKGYLWYILDDIIYEAE